MTMTIVPIEHDVLERETERRALWAAMDEFLKNGGAIRGAADVKTNESSPFDRINAKTAKALLQLPSGRIRQVAVMIGRGHRLEAVVNATKLSVTTVATYRTRILRAFDVTTNAGLATALGMDQDAGGEVIAEKCCTHCQTIKPLGDFHRMSRSRDGHAPECKQCDTERANKRRAAKAAQVAA